MTPALRTWLHQCPLVKGVSVLTADLHACRLIDLDRLLARAISQKVGAYLWKPLRTQLPPKYHERNATAYALRSRGTAMIMLRNGVAVTQGRLTTGVGICEAAGCAVIRLKGSTIPDTVATAMIDRELSELIDSPVFRRSSYRVLSANADLEGLTVWFTTPRRRIPISEALKQSPR